MRPVVELTTWAMLTWAWSMIVGHAAAIALMHDRWIAAVVIAIGIGLAAALGYKIGSRIRELGHLW